MDKPKARIMRIERDWDDDNDCPVVRQFIQSPTGQCFLDKSSSLTRGYIARGASTDFLRGLQAYENFLIGCMGFELDSLTDQQEAKANDDMDSLVTVYGSGESGDVGDL